jgi:hypothetical protein
MIIGMGDYSEPGEHIHELLPPGPGNTYCNIVIHDHVTSIAADIFLDMIEIDQVRMMDPVKIRAAKCFINFL